MITVKTPPTESLVSIIELEEQLRLSGCDYSIPLVARCLSDAIDDIEKELGLSLNEQTLVADFECFSRELHLLRGPVKSVVSVTYTDSNGVAQTLPVSDYSLRDAEFMPFLLIKDIPQTEDGSLVEVEYVAGFDRLPGSIRAAILMLAADLNENAEIGAERKLHENPAYERLLSKHRVPRLAL